MSFASKGDISSRRRARVTRNLRRLASFIRRSTFSDRRIYDPSAMSLVPGLTLRTNIY